MTQQTWTMEARRQPVVLAGGSQRVRDLVARACASAGVAPVFVPGLDEGLALNPVVLLVGPEQAAGGTTGQRDVIVVGMTEDENSVWGTAANLASSRVVILPQGAGWLAEYLGRRLGSATSGSVVGFLGAAGGCGVSTFAYWCARQIAGAGKSTVLVDGHPLNGGLDLALGIEDRPGVRWHDLSDIRGTLNPEQLASALPSDGRLSVLSHAARAGTVGGGPGGAMPSSGAVVDAARGAFDVTVIDLGNGPAARFLGAVCDHVVLLVPSRPRSVAAAGGVLRARNSVPMTVVLRGPVQEGLDAWLVADLMGRPGPLPFLPFVRGARQAEAAGRMVSFVVPRSVRKVVRSVTSAIELLE
ncbi:hypothetical protein FDK12_13820 [Arthrobacter sp. NamB2]|uniref:septum site-determining protein Ssd n=1 Tax=Arthrobacter sp. NamB2 TaxID=2576035 RepID=UPI0010C99EDE|nr:septum site-determining protein Ssd [Arthrobacter sp. NamB2]TKV26445.1 hypothetical protein FDK12_13820 [Arthrobacter sp. NamB2]